MKTLLENPNLARARFPTRNQLVRQACDASGETASRDASSPARPICARTGSTASRRGRNHGVTRCAAEAAVAPIIERRSKPHNCRPGIFQQARVGASAAGFVSPAREDGGFALKRSGARRRQGFGRTDRARLWLPAYTAAARRRFCSQVLETEGAVNHADRAGIGTIANISSPRTRSCCATPMRNRSTNTSTGSFSPRQSWDAGRSIAGEPPGNDHQRHGSHVSWKRRAQRSRDAGDMRPQRRHRAVRPTTGPRARRRHRAAAAPEPIASAGP